MEGKEEKDMDDVEDGRRRDGETGWEERKKERKKERKMVGGE